MIVIGEEADYFVELDGTGAVFNRAETNIRNVTNEYSFVYFERIPKYSVYSVYSFQP